MECCFYQCFSTILILLEIGLELYMQPLLSCQSWWFWKIKITEFPTPAHYLILFSKVCSDYRLNIFVFLKLYSLIERIFRILFGDFNNMLSFIYLQHLSEIKLWILFNFSFTPVPLCHSYQSHAECWCLRSSEIWPSRGNWRFGSILDMTNQYYRCIPFFENSIIFFWRWKFDP